VLVVSKHDYDIPERIKNIKLNEVLYNIPVSANIFRNYDSIKDFLGKGNKKAMQISHYLYGIYFGPSIGNINLPINKNIREFFSWFADRPRIENIIKYSSENMSYPTFNAKIGEEIASGGKTLLSDLYIQRLYHPFYIGSSVSTEANDISKFNVEQELQDLYLQDYLEKLRGYNNLLDYYKTLFDFSSRQKFYFDYIDGKTLPTSVKAELDARLNRIKSDISKNNSLQFTVFYKKDDTTGKIIADHFRDMLDEYFRNSFVVPDIQIKSDELDDYGNWKRTAESNARQGVVTFLVKGWNYKFDMLDELAGQFIEKSDFDEVEGYYNTMIAGASGTASISPEGLVYRIAGLFNANSIMIPLVGLQNYALYSTQDNGPKTIAASFSTHKDIEILLLPYYWRKK
jgi:hypothetical protein